MADQAAQAGADVAAAARGVGEARVEGGRTHRERERVRGEQARGEQALGAGAGGAGTRMVARCAGRTTSRAHEGSERCRERAAQSAREPPVER